jgi:hypothetical protein
VALLRTERGRQSWRTQLVEDRAADAQHREAAKRSSGSP